MKGEKVLNRPGELVTREQLQAQIWGTDTVVDFDHSLGSAIAKLREVLGDSSTRPRFIETLSRRGYRFIAPVETVCDPVIRTTSPAAMPAMVEPLPVTPDIVATPILVDQPALAKDRGPGYARGIAVAGLSFALTVVVLFLPEKQGRTAAPGGRHANYLDRTSVSRRHWAGELCGRSHRRGSYLLPSDAGRKGHVGECCRGETARAFPC